MTRIVLIPAVYAAAVLDTSLGPAFNVGPAAPAMLAVVALAWSIAFAPARGYLSAGTVGFVSDLVSPGRLGVDLACYTIAGYLLFALATASGALAPVLCVWPAASIMVLGPAMMRFALGEVDVPWTTLAVGGLLSAAYTAALTLPLVGAAAWTSRARRRRWA